MEDTLSFLHYYQEGYQTTHQQKYHRLITLVVRIKYMFMVDTREVLVFQ